MGRYRTKTDGYESGYESDGETKYSPVKKLGEGEFSTARLFKSESNKSVVVLNPLTTPGDMKEAEVKHRFFKRIYPDQTSYLFEIAEGDYRLVVPHVPYVSYEDLTIDTQELQRILFHSAAQALKDCHDKEIVVIDLKMDNIYFDAKTQKSYFIDGVFSALKGTTIDPFVFQKESPEVVAQFKTEYEYIPPECWSVEPVPVLATPEMDIYALGILMDDLLKESDSQVKLLISRCLNKDPMSRPTLGEILAFLDELTSAASKPDSDSDAEFGAISRFK